SDQDVVARPAVQGLRAVVADQRVAGTATEDALDVAVHGVADEAALVELVAVIAVGAADAHEQGRRAVGVGDRVGAVAAVDVVGALVAVEHVVAGVPVHVVLAPAAGERVVARTAVKVGLDARRHRRSVDDDQVGPAAGVDRDRLDAGARAGDGAGVGLGAGVA